MIDPLAYIEMQAAKAGSRYLEFTVLIGGMERSALAEPTATTPNAVRRLRRGLETVGDQLLASEENVLTADIEQVLEMAREEAARQTDSKRPSESDDVARAVFEYGIEEIEAQVVRDVAQVVRFHRKRGLDARLRADARGIPLKSAVDQIRIENAMDKNGLWFTDRIGRRIASHKHVKRLWRGLLRDGYLQSLSLELALRGAEIARIVHPDPRARGFGQIVKLDGSKPDLSSYEDVFHPNARASLMAEAAFLETYGDTTA